jgi:hypothetical protein
LHPVLWQVVDKGAVGLGDGVRTQIASARMRLDGWVHISTVESHAYLLTKPLKFQGTRLQINANAGGAGQIRVQLIDPTSTKALATSSPFFGNAVDATLSFSGQQHCVQSLAGRAVQVRFDFVGEGVELFAFQFV